MQKTIATSSSILDRNLEQIGFKPIFRTPYNYVLGDVLKDTETVHGVSETIPDQSLTMRQIIDRHSRGLPIPSREPRYSEIEFPELAKMDLVEIQELTEITKQEVADLQQKLKQAQFMERKKAYEATQRPLPKSQFEQESPPVQPQQP